MYQVYENFLAWLLMFTRWDSSIRFNLEDGLDQELENYFWDAIAPDHDWGFRDRRRDDELQRVRIHGILSRARVVIRRKMLELQTVEC